MASAVESSHFPDGVPSYAPFLAKAAWISLMRSGVGAACPFTFLVLVFFRLELFPEVLWPVVVPVVLLDAASDFVEPALAAAVEWLALLLFVDFLCEVVTCVAAAWTGQMLAASTASSDPTTVIL